MGTLGLILYRLEKIEQNTSTLVTREQYTIEQEHLKGRVTDLETAATKDKESRDRLRAGVATALIVPVLVNLPRILDALGGMTA